MKRSLNIRLVSASLIGILVVAYTLWVPSPKWEVTVFADLQMRKPVGFGVSREINFDSAMDPSIAGQTPAQGPIRWDGCLELTRQSRVTFVLGSDDGARVFVRQQELLSPIEPLPFRKTIKEVVLPAGRHPMTVEFLKRKPISRATLQIGIDGRPATFSPSVVRPLTNNAVEC